MTDAAVDLDHFFNLGRHAYLNDKPGAPALNAEVMEAIGDAKVGDGHGKAIMKAYSRGYEIERRDEIARLLDKD